MPAAFTIPSIPPMAPAPCSTARVTDGSCVTSASTAVPPVSRATDVSLLRSQSSRVRAAPSAENSSAVRCPIPEAAPVIRIRRPWRRPGIYLFRRRPLDHRRSARGFPGMQHRQNLLRIEPHRFLGNRIRNAAKPERCGEFEIADHATPLLEHPKNAVGTAPYRGLHEALGHAIEPGLAHYLGFLGISVVALHRREMVAHQFVVLDIALHERPHVPA